MKLSSYMRSEESSKQGQKQGFLLKVQKSAFGGKSNYCFLWKTMDAGIGRSLGYANVRN